MFIFGEPGLEKDEAAALIHFGSRGRREPMARIDCERAGNGLAAELFGAGSRPGLLTWLGSGTLLLNNVHLARPEPLLIPEKYTSYRGGSSHLLEWASFLRHPLPNNVHLGRPEPLPTSLLM